MNHFFWGPGGHFLNIHAARFRGDESNTLAFAVNHDTQVIFLDDVMGLFN